MKALHRFWLQVATSPNNSRSDLGFCRKKGDLTFQVGESFDLFSVNSFLESPLILIHFQSFWLFNHFDPTPYHLWKRTVWFEPVAIVARRKHHSQMQKLRRHRVGLWHSDSFGLFFPSQSFVLNLDLWPILDLVPPGARCFISPWSSVMENKVKWREWDVVYSEVRGV